MITENCRQFLPAFLAAILAATPLHSHGEEVRKKGLQVSGLVDTQLSFNDGEESWLQRGPGKFRYDESDSGDLQLNQLALGLRYSFNLESHIKIAAHYYPDPDSSVELTEAYWQHRSMNSKSWRSRYRIGAFHPEFSLENRGKFWTSPYTLNSSFINTWIGEEIRTIGAEGKWTWSGRDSKGTQHRVSFTGALFGFNDPMGAMISWRGWAGHDRQTGINGTLPARELPILEPQPGGSELSPDFEPFMEIDDRPGYYLAATWELPRTLEVQAVFYDNLADDELLEDGQYGWRTWFYQIGAKWQLPGDFTLLSQVLRGNTIMNVDVVDNDFESAYLMLVKTHGRHRLAARWEYSEVIDLDDTDIDYNDEEGDAWTLAYSYLLPKNWKFSIEGTRRYSNQKSRIYFSEPTRMTEKQLLLSVRYYY
ncbi:hypothetical protein EY643_11665 [Halioglobus maricola]|uniref:DUF560 domain-containing protein n=1 Tax=Halioglobus maricola TaxID=2601894 RepID=A0A5P9NL76_9GAMM|nr:hypothetical protein [Halioglobus maricola]QFU76265.1 hypothetical protein EY643_11665 [Halioglobus maricola]